MPPGFLALERLISEKLIVQTAKKKGVAPTPGEVDNEFKARKEDGEQINRMIELGVAEADIKSVLTVEMCQFNLLTMGVTVTDQQVTEHYNLNKFVYTAPATVDLRVIVVRTADDRTKVDAALRTKDFATVAREMSTDLTKFDGGALPTVVIERLPQNVLNEVTRTAAGSTTNWIESEGAFVKYRVDKKTEARQLPLDEQLKRQIKRKMMLDIGRSKNDVKSMLDETRRSAKIEITSPGLQKLWDAFVRAAGGGG
jgi:foldase protein PrsA